MQKDFHYYCIGILARSAGFDAKDALTIAYASQYIDDSTESELIPLDVEKGKLRFDPVRTAHVGIEAGEWSTQKRIYMPFHFIPPRKFSPNEEFSFITKSDSEFVKSLLELADKEENHRRRLCRIGLALHTYADTWSHKGFSGRQSETENNVESIYVFDDEANEYKKLTIENIIYDVSPQIGHAEAGILPDITFVRWKYKRHSGEEVIRNNPSDFLESAKAIYEILCKMAGENTVDPISWDKIEPDIKYLMSFKPKIEFHIANWIVPKAQEYYYSHDLEKRCDQWKEKFAKHFNGDNYSYDKLDWRNEAIDANTDWDKFKSRDWERLAPLKIRPNFWDSSWVHFHRSALHQRHVVLEGLP